MASKPEIGARPGAAAIVAALLLPPLGVFIAHGLGLSFWIAVALTCLGFVPGVMFALLTVLKPEMAPRRLAR